MEKKYNPVEIDVIVFEDQDIILDSNELPIQPGT